MLQITIPRKSFFPSTAESVVIEGMERPRLEYWYENGSFLRPKRVYGGRMRSTGGNKFAYTIPVRFFDYNKIGFRIVSNDSNRKIFFQSKGLFNYPNLTPESAKIRRSINIDYVAYQVLIPVNDQTPDQAGAFFNTVTNLAGNKTFISLLDGFSSQIPLNTNLLAGVPIPAYGVDLAAFFDFDFRIENTSIVISRKTVETGNPSPFARLKINTTVSISPNQMLSSASQVVRSLGLSVNAQPISGTIDIAPSTSTEFGKLLELSLRSLQVSIPGVNNTIGRILSNKLHAKLGEAMPQLESVLNDGLNDFLTELPAPPLLQWPPQNKRRAWQIKKINSTRTGGVTGFLIDLICVWSRNTTREVNR